MKEGSHFCARLVLAFFALFLGGVLLEYDLDGKFFPSAAERKPLAAQEEKQPEIPVIRGDTAITFQKLYVKSQETVSGALPERNTLNGKTLADIYRFYPPERGYEVRYADNALVIRQRVDDFSPRQKEKYRLKAYQEWVAIYQGASAQSDVLQKVTSVRWESLPPDVQEKLKNGSYEFDTIEQVNDVLMNFDEWTE